MDYDHVRRILLLRVKLMFSRVVDGGCHVHSSNKLKFDRYIHGRTSNGDSSQYNFIGLKSSLKSKTLDFS
jgi:hypothetical protein